MEKITKGNLRFPFEPSLYKGGIKRRKISEAYLNTLVPFVPFKIEVLHQNKCKEYKNILRSISD